MPRITSRLLSLTLVALFNLPAQTPVIDRLLPQAASPGDLVIIEGTNLSAVTSVRFRLQDSGPGFALSYVGDVPVVTLPDGRLGVTTPFIGSANPSSSLPSGVDPLGSARLVTPTTTSAARSFIFQQASGGRVASLGAGSTQRGGLGAAITTFDITGGLPFSSVSFTQGTLTSLGAFRLVNATPGATALLVAGVPAVSPSVTVGDGLVALALDAPFVAVPAVTVDASGVAVNDLSFPGLTPFFLDVALQYALIDPTSGAVGVARGLRLTL